MNYPLISEYIEAIKSSEDNLNQLSYLRPVLNGDGQPVMSSGNFAVVFKMKDEQTGKLHAIKCFLKEQEGRAEAYKQIAKELENVSSTFLTPIKYYEHELFVDSKATKDIEFPVLLMDWVEGVPLDKYVRDNIDDSYELELLTWNFKLLAVWLLEQPFAHGDLKPDNIIVRDDGTMVLVDYDGMYVPAMKGQCARELGSPDFRHPQRTEQDFDKRIDDFPIVSIALSLKAIALEPELLERYGAKDRLLFSEADYRDLGNCRFVKEHFPSQSPELDMLYALFMLVWRDSKRQGNSLLAIMETAICQPEQLIEEIYSTEVTREDLANAWVDEYGAKYSADKKRLLKGPNIKEYTINKRTRVIGNCSFQECNNLQSLVIPDSVKWIGRAVFDKCVSLKSIKLPQFVQFNEEEFIDGDWDYYYEELLTYYFEGCINLNRIEVHTDNQYYCDEDGVLFTKDKTKLLKYPPAEKNKSYAIPVTVKTIGGYAFSGCANLEHIYIPKSVETIEKYAFKKCINLKEAKIPESVKSIEKNIFYQCESIEEFVFPESIHYMDFTGWKSLKKIKLPEGLQYIGDYMFHDCVKLQTVEMPNTILCIGCHAFAGCSSLRDIRLPDGIEEIEYGAFKDCINLQDIILPQNLKKLGKHSDYKYDICHQIRGVFENCSSIKNIIIPPNVEEIGAFCFMGCSNLESVTLPNALKYMDDEDRPFVKCEKLEKIYVHKPVHAFFIYYHKHHDEISGFDSLSRVIPIEKIKVIDNSDYCEVDSAVFSKDRSILYSISENTKQYKVPEGVKEIAPIAFKDHANLESIILNDSVEKIGSRAFENCEKLSSVVLSNNLLEIGYHAFANCTSLTFIVIPDSVTKIGEEAFYKCYYLRSIFIPDSVTEIGNDAFNQCDSLLTIVIPKGTKEKFRKLLRSYPHIYMLREQTVKDMAINPSPHFVENKYHTKVTEEDLTNAWVDEYGAKYSADKKRLLKGPNKNIEKYRISEGTLEVGDFAFNNCYHLQSIVIPKSVTQIGNFAFRDCWNLQSTSIPDTVTKIGDGAFLDCQSLLSFVIPKSVTQIGNFAFRDCCSLQFISIPDIVTKIGDGAFMDCESLQSIFISNSVTQIGSFAFLNCDSLQSIFIPNSVTQIGEYAFSGCGSLRSISVAKGNKKYDSRNNCNAIIETVSNKMIVGCEITQIPNSVTQIGEDAFLDCKNLQSIRIPNSITQIGEDAFSSSSYTLQTIIIPKGTREKFQKLLPKNTHQLREQ